MANLVKYGCASWLPEISRVEIKFITIWFIFVCQAVALEIFLFPTCGSTSIMSDNILAYLFCGQA